MFQINKSESAIRQKLIFFGLAALIVFIPIGGCIYFTLSFPDFNTGQPHQSDAQMIANFQKYKSDFERLRQMILEDKGLTRVDDNWTEPRDPLTIGIKSERIAQYRRMFQQLGIPRGFSATAERDRIEFIASAQGWVASGSSKCYVYLKTRPDELLDDLDKLSLQEKPFGTGYRHIEGDWYLYFYGD
jgi:hypothetical protein